MRRNLFTCDHCGAQAETPFQSLGSPYGWSEVPDRYHLCGACHPLYWSMVNRHSAEVRAFFNPKPETDPDAE